MTKSLAAPSQTNSTFACLLYDSTMKAVLGTAANEDLFIGLIEFLIPGKHIASLQLLNKEHHGIADSEKSVIFDLLCVDRDSGEEFEVEMQNAEEDSYRDRILYYSFFPIREQLAQKKERCKKNPDARMDYSLKPVYVISFVNFKLEHESDKALEDGYLSRYEIRNGANSEILTPSLNFVFVEMGRLRLKHDEYDQCRSKMEELVFAFKYMHTFEKLPERFRDNSLVERLADASRLAKLTTEELSNYEHAMTTELDRQLQLEFALKKGREEGRVEGREEIAVEIAKSLLSRGLAVEDICEITGLPAEKFTD